MRNLTLLVIIALAAACAEAGDDASTEETELDAGAEAATTAAPDTGMIHNTPEGGAVDWAADIGAGLDSVPDLAGRDPAAAQGAVLNLYVLRQEYLEGYYGEGGRLEVTPELAGAIDTNEVRFHALMSELAKESPDSATVVALTDSLAAQTARVRAAAEAAGAPTPWAEDGP
ncbi:MAG: hypothetical protein R3314_06085 [Longimicrobiales bacterium]|nr:hypothetical protein [Longimicrobiales bacterium]